MSKHNPERFPWGDNNPGRKARLIVTIVVAFICTMILYVTFAQNPARHTDFSNVWFGARMLLDGRDPYPLLGPGRLFQMDYPLLYPASSLVLVTPFALLQEHTASLVFVALSTGLMIYGITSDGWHRLPMIASAAFLDSVISAQWTLILTAALFLPWLAFVTPAKPQSGLPVLGATRSTSALLLALVSASILALIAYLLLPDWPAEWLANIRTANVVRAPIFYPVGFLCTVVLIRWKRPETWLVFLGLCLPQTFMWYSSLILLATAKTYREAAALSLVSTAGYLVATYLVFVRASGIGPLTWNIYLATTFLPAAGLILLRPNVGPSPAWSRMLGMTPAPGQ